MPIGAHITSSTTHGGSLQGTGVATVKFGQFAAAVAMDPASTLHKCSITPPPAHLSSSPVSSGSSSVFLGGKPAARVGDPVGCGATILSGAFDVLIGG